MGMTTGGQLVAKMLKKEGVRHIFTLCGLHVAPIYAGCVEEGIQVIDMRHEQAAAHAADAYARMTKGLGVAVVTAGPGVTDALTGVANAYAASSPLLLLGGAAPTFNQSRGSLQEMEQVDLFHRISKWSDRVPSPELVPSYLSKAARVALSGRPGPVFLELAWDVLCNGIDEDSARIPEKYRTEALIYPDPRKVEEAMALLAAAERPAVIAGSSVYWDGAGDELRRFSETAQLPVFLNGAGRDRHAVRFPAQLRRRANFWPPLEDRAGGHRPDRDRPQPPGRGGDRGEHARRLEVICQRGAQSRSTHLFVQPARS